MFEFDDEIKELFLDKMKTLLIQGETSRTVKKTTGEDIKYDIHDDGEIPVERVEINRIVQTTTLKSTPTWLLQIISESLSIENCIHLLESKGYIVVDPSIKVEQSKRSKGVSSETINTIYDQLLGVNQNLSLPESTEE